MHGTFQSLDSQTMVEGEEQQFKYTQSAVCRDPVCNNRSRFMLDINKSRYEKSVSLPPYIYISLPRFVDFQKVRIQGGAGCR